MAIDTYLNLKKAVLAQTHRGDLAQKFDNFLAIAEVDIRSHPQGSLKLNDIEKISTATTSTTSRYLALPSGIQSSRGFTISIDDSLGNLEFRTPSQLFVRNGTGTPCFFSIANNEIVFDVMPDKVYSVTLTYTSNAAPLSDANQTNEILDKYPTIYFYGCLKQAFLYTEDIEQSSIYDGLFSEAIASANMAEHDIKYQSQPQESVAWAP
ncbi:MAG: phage adaptor protein [Marinomonas sp.]